MDLSLPSNDAFNSYMQENVLSNTEIKSHNPEAGSPLLRERVFRKTSSPINCLQNSKTSKNLHPMSYELAGCNEDSDKPIGVTLNACAKEFIPQILINECGNTNGVTVDDEDWKRILKDCNDAIEATLNPRLKMIECQENATSNDVEEKKAGKTLKDTEVSNSKFYRGSRLNTVEIEERFLDELINSDNDQDELRNDTFYTACSSPPQSLGLSELSKTLSEIIKPNTHVKSSERKKDTTFQPLFYGHVSTNELRKFIKKRPTPKRTTSQNFVSTHPGFQGSIRKIIDNAPKTDAVAKKITKSNKFLDLEEEIKAKQVFNNKTIGTRKYPKRSNTNSKGQYQFVESCTYHFKTNEFSEANIGCIGRVYHTSKCELNYDRIYSAIPLFGSTSKRGTIYTNELSTEFGKITQKIKRAYLSY